MVRENKIKELVFGKVAGLLIDKLGNFGFKYSKSKHEFVRQQENVNHIIYLSYRNSKN